VANPRCISHGDASPFTAVYVRRDKAKSIVHYRRLILQRPLANARSTTSSAANVTSDGGSNIAPLMQTTTDRTGGLSNIGVD